MLTGPGPCFLGARSGQYETGEAAAERWTREEALQRLPSRVLADELVRRIAVAEGKAAVGHADEAD